MRLPDYRIISTIPLLVLAACSTNSRNLSYSDLVDQDLGNDTGRVKSLLIRAEQGAMMDQQEAERTLIAGVDGYVQLALERNPSILAAKQRIRRLLERIPQVTSLSDPMLKISPIGDMAETAAGQVQLMSGVSQRLPYPGKLETRGKIATQDVAIAKQDLQHTRLSVIADTRRAYWSLYYSVRAIEVTTRSRDLLSQLREVVQAKYRVGSATQQAVLRASVELNNLENELITLHQRRVTAAGMLNTLLDRRVDANLVDPIQITLHGFDGQLDNLLTSANQENPTIIAMRERIERFHQQRALARLGRYPDFNVSFNYNIVDNEGLAPVTPGDDQWWFGFGINLPIWQDRLDAAEREATRGILETAGMLASAQNKIAFRIQDAFVKVETQQRQSALLRDVIVPESQQTVEASLSGYRSGAVDFLTLIDNWRHYLDFQLMFEASLTELERSFAQLQEAVGHDLQRENIELAKSRTPKPTTKTSTDAASSSEDKR